MSPWKKIAALFLLLLSFPVAAASDEEVRTSIRKDVQAAWRAADFQALDRMSDEYARTRAKTPAGYWRLAILTHGLSDAIQIEWSKDLSLPDAIPGCSCGTPAPRNYPLADQRWDAIAAKTEAWLKKYPRSAQAHIAKAHYLTNRAGFYRGSSYARDVPAEAWPLIEKYNQQARMELESSRAISAKNPVWFSLMFGIAADQSWDGPAYSDLVRDFMADGQDYLDTYWVIFNRLQPKWGGSVDQMEMLARNAAERTQAEEGKTLYSRLYWFVYAQYGDAIFDHTKLDWPTMRQGFIDMVARYPDAGNFNGMAKFACLKSDNETMKTAMIRIGDDVDLETWKSDANSYARCRAFSKADTEMRADPPSWIYKVAVAVRDRLPKEVISAVPADTKAGVSIQIGKDGRVGQAYLVQPSGNPAYDAAVVKALHELPSLPAPVKGAAYPYAITLQVTAGAG